MNEERDLRLGGAWTFRQRVKNDVVWLLASVALATLWFLPVSVLRHLGRAVGLLAHALAGHARRTAFANVARVYPQKDAAERRMLVRLCFISLGDALGQTVAMMRRGRCPVIQLSPEGQAVLAKALASGRGVVFPSAHLGPWERVAASLVAAHVPLVTLARESYDPRFTRLYERIRANHGVGVVWRTSPGAAASILRTLRRGKVLGMPMDLRSRVSSCDAAFLGHQAQTAIGPARLALRSGAAVVVGTAAPSDDRADRRHGVHGGLVVTMTCIATDDLHDDDEGARLLTARINEELSRRILALPHGWVWMHERWTCQSRV